MATPETHPPKTRKRKPDGAPPAFGSTIRAVTLETGIHPMALREWERRFGFPSPERRPGSDRRLYSAADVARLKLLKGALGRGYRIGDVIQKPNAELEAIAQASGLPFGALLEPFGSSHDVPKLEPFIRLLASDRIDDFEHEVRKAKVSMDVRQFIVRFAHPLMVEVGEAWAQGRLSVRHEHMASDSLITLIRTMLAEVQPSGVAPRIVFATLPSEAYTLPTLLVSLYLAASGAKIRCAGHQMPCEELLQAAKALRGDIIAISISEDVDSRDANRYVRKLRSGLSEECSLWLGGAGVAAMNVPTRIAQSLGTWIEIDEALRRARTRR